MSRVLSLAGFQVTIIGRFWVTAEVIWGSDQPYLTWPELTAKVIALAITLILCYFS